MLLGLQATSSLKNRTRHAHQALLQLCKVSWPQHAYIMTSMIGCPKRICVPSARDHE